MCLRCRLAGWRRERRARTRQNFRTQVVALGTAIASAVFCFKQKTAYEIGVTGVQTCALPICAAGLVNGRRLALVKVARRREHLLFDVPVVGSETVPVMRETGTTVLAVEAGRTLMLDKEQMLEAANEAGIAIVGLED